ncbi:hypothetical protein GCM10010278_40910 [Streptomyces melanogenes]|nr:hypothetical protein GCM10010278_40910 [Streptomyces melanogenes]
MREVCADLHLRRPVALNFIRPELLDPDDERQRIAGRFPVRPALLPESIISMATVHNAGDAGETEQPPGPPDLLTPEWQVLSAAKTADPTEDFALVDASLSGPLSTVFSQVRQVEWLREVRGEGLFLRVDDYLIEQRVASSDAVAAHAAAFGRFRDHRRSERIQDGSDLMQG